MTAGVKTSAVPTAETADEVLANRNGGTVRVPVAKLGAQLEALRGPAYETRAELLADTDWPENVEGRVYGDSNTALRGVYTRNAVGVSPTWTRRGPLPEGDGAAKADKTTAITAGAGLTGGGTLAADRTLAIDEASEAEAIAGTASGKVVTPRRLAAQVAPGARLGRKGTDIASASSIDLGAATGDYVDVTGTTTMTALGTVAAGIERTLRFVGALTLVHNATSLILPGGESLTIEAGDVAVFRSLGSGNWRCVSYQPASALPRFARRAVTGPMIAMARANKQALDDWAPASKNLFNKATVTAGFFIDPSTGALTSNASFGTSDFIPVEPATAYYGASAVNNMRFVAYFAEDRALITGGPANVSTFTTPANCYWVRVTYYTGGLSTFQLEKGSSATAYAVWGRSITLGNDAVTEGALAAASVSPGKTTFLELGKNLFSKTDATIGYFLGHDNSVTANATYDYSDYIAVTPGQTLVSSHAMRFTTFYNASKAWVSGGSSTSTSTITVPSGVYFVRVTISHSTLSGFQLEVGSTPTGYEKWGYRPNYRLVVDDVAVATTWKNKAWASLGDSITAAGAWQAIVAAALGLTHSNYGSGGTKLSGGSGDTNAMCQDARIDAIPTTIDLLTLMGGINDWAQNVALGSIGSTDPTTYYGALETFASKAMARWPAKRIVLCTITYAEFTATYASRGWSDARTNTAGLTPQDYMEAVRRVGAKYGLPVIDVGGRSGWNRYNIASWVTDESGNYIHPQSSGYAAVASVVAGDLKRIEPLS